MKTQTVRLIVEKSEEGDLHGRILVKGNLIVEVASTVQDLKKSLAALALEMERVEITGFDVLYDLTTVFEQYRVNINEIAERAGINAGLMRQYAAGLKFPSADRVSVIETAIRSYGKDLAKIKLVKPDRKKRLAA